ncbi:MAG: hypothetical protein IPG25_15920 [Proteobacteria bacterium]|nr:hypothetical protein [Pseudomonadota bacterium]
MTARKSRALTNAGRKFLDAAVEIQLDRATPADLAYIARQFVQATLPHSDPKANTWSRKNGNYTLSLQTGFDDQGQAIGLPYGVIPRLLVYWLVTEATRTKEPVLQLGHNLAAFMRELGLDPTHGGKRGDPQRLEVQMRRFFSARMAFFEQLDEGGRRGEAAEFMQVARSYVLWWDSKQPQQGALWGSSVKLDREFFEAITAAPIPVDMRALKALKRSPLALDLYALCSYEAFRLERTGRARVIPWRALMKQLGADYDRADKEDAAKDFARNCRLALRKIAAVMPSLKLGNVKGGLAILPGSRPAIEARPKA